MQRQDSHYSHCPFYSFQWSRKRETSTTTDLKLQTASNLLYSTKQMVSITWSRLGYRSGSDLSGPAATLGALGFDLAYEIAFTDINQSAQHWQDAMPDGVVADDMLTTHRLHLRKGLPFSMEVGGSLGFLQDSDLTTVGLDLKYAAVEGFRLLPDLAFRTNIHTVLGAADVHMLLTGGDVILSKEFGVAGLFRLSPHVGYNLVYVYGSSHQVTFFNDEYGTDDLRDACSEWISSMMLESSNIAESWGCRSWVLTSPWWKIAIGPEIGPTQAISESTSKPGKPAQSKHNKEQTVGSFSATGNGHIRAMNCEPIT